MACPYFLPTGLMADSGIFQAIVPLGEICVGQCRAREAAFSPESEFQRDFCNFGYAGHLCARFPGMDAADAIRFTIAADDGNCVGIRFARERDHLPHSAGSLEFRRQGDEWRTDASDIFLQAQAKAYLNSYLRRRPRIE